MILRHIISIILITVLFACSITENKDLPAPPSDPNGDQKPNGPQNIVWEIKAHNAPIYDLAWNPSGTLLGVVASDEVTTIIDGNTLEIYDWRANLSGRFRINNTAITWSPDGKHVAVPGLIRETTTWRIVTEFMEDGRISDSLAYSPDGSLIAGSSRPFSGGQAGCICLVIWDALTGEEVHTHVTPLDPSYNWFFGYISKVAWSPDNKRVAATTRYGTIIYDLPTETVVFELPPAESVAWSPDGLTLALTETREYYFQLPDAGVVYLFDANTGGLLARKRVHDGVVYDIVWHPDNKRLVTGGSDGFVKVLEADSLEVINSIKVLGVVSAVDIHPEGTSIAIGTRAGFTYIVSSTLELADLQRIPIGGGRIYAIAVSPDEKLIVTGGDNEIIRIWDSQTAKLISEFVVQGQIRAIDFNSTGNWLAVAADYVSLYNASNWSFVANPVEPRPQSLSFSPNEDVLAISLVTTLLLVEISTGRILLQINPTEMEKSFLPLEAPYWSPDGQSIALTFQNGMIWLIDLSQESGLNITKLPPLMGSVGDLSWNSEGSKLVITGGDEGGWKDRRVIVLDVFSLEVIYEKQYSSEGWNTVAGFTPDDKAFWVGGSSDKVYQAGPDYGSGDGFAFKVWNMDDGSLRYGIEMNDTVGAASFTTNGKSIISGTWSGWLAKWVVP